MNPLTARRLFLVLPALVASASAQWPSNPAANLAVCDATGDQAVPKIAAGGDGSTWTAWFDSRGGSYAVYAQKLTPQGVEVFAHNGLLVSANPQNTSLVDWGIESDGAGGCVLAFTDIRAGGDLDVYAYRIDVAGNFLWGANGIALSNNADFESNPKVARLSDGSFAVTWGRQPSPGPGAIHVQKISAAGATQFAGEGVQIVGPGTEKPGFSAIAASDAGGCIVGYVRDIATFASSRHFRAQKFDANGNALWNAGAPLAIYDASVLPIAYQPIIQSDGAGGAVFAWHSSLALYDCWIQRVTAAGAEVHPHNGVQVSTEANRHKLDPQIAVLAGGDVVVAFNKRNSAQSQWATCVQRIDGAGTRLWTNDGIELIPLNGVPKQFERCVANGNDAIVLTCEQTNYPAQGLRVLGFRVDGAGANVWAGAPLVVSSVLSPKDKIPVATDAWGTVRALWDDARNDSGDMYAQNVNPDGTLGPFLPVCGTTFCFGDGSGAACPCANNGVAGNGCANSLNANGANLSATGTASIAADTVVLGGTGMPNSTVLYFQGTSQQSSGAGVQFGDGKRCAGGSVIRLGTKVNSAGASSYPVVGDASVSVRGLVTVPGSRTYQAWYRNSASFCTVSTFNLSNGLEVAWGV